MQSFLEVYGVTRGGKGSSLRVPRNRLLNLRNTSDSDSDGDSDSTDNEQEIAA
jgi:hypothetical protein